MAGITRVNGFGNYVVGSYRSTANIGAFLVTIKNASNSAQDIRAEDDAANEVVEAVMMATNAIGSSFTDSNAGTATLLVDDTQWDAASLQAAIRHLGTAVGPNDIDVSGSTVAAASTLTAA
tara:strand:+ start:4569 stop:4931 length:363 start_codon:yes stop_codon:yes gene_type:complete